MYITELDVTIPDEYVTERMRSTNWTPNPIRSIDDIDSSWIGNKLSQVTFSTVKTLLLIEKADALSSWIDYSKKQIFEAFTLMESGEFTTQQGSLYILRQLRCIFLVRCLLIVRTED